MQPLGGDSRLPKDYDAQRKDGNKKESSQDAQNAKVSGAAISQLLTISQDSQTGTLPNLEEVVEKRKQQRQAAFKKLEESFQINLPDTLAELEKLGLYNPNIKTEAEMEKVLKEFKQNNPEVQDKNSQDLVFAYMKSPKPDELILCGYSRHGFNTVPIRLIQGPRGTTVETSVAPYSSLVHMLKALRFNLNLAVFPPAESKNMTPPLTYESAKEELTKRGWYKKEMKDETTLKSLLREAVTAGSTNPFVFRDSTDEGLTVMYLQNGKDLKRKFQIVDGKWKEWPIRVSDIAFDTTEDIVRSLNLTQASSYVTAPSPKGEGF